ADGVVELFRQVDVPFVIQREHAHARLDLDNAVDAGLAVRPDHVVHAHVDPGVAVNLARLHDLPGAVGAHGLILPQTNGAAALDTADLIGHARDGFLAVVQREIDCHRVAGAGAELRDPAVGALDAAVVGVARARLDADDVAV